MDGHSEVDMQRGSAAFITSLGLRVQGSGCRGGFQGLGLVEGVGEGFRV